MSDITPPPPPPGGLTPPPGYTAYGGPDQVRPGLQRIGTISKVLWIIMAVEIPLQLISAVLSWRLSNKAADFVAGRITEDDFKTATRSPLTAIAGLLFLPIAVLTIVWMYRMASNLKAVGRTGLTWAPIWAIFGWFLPPCVIYAIPWLMFAELWRASDPAVPLTDPSWKRGKVTPLVHAWWVLYGLLPLIGIAGSANMFRRFQQNDLLAYARQQQQHVGLNFVLGLVSVAAAAVYMVLVRQLSDRHMRTINEI
jgi:hypothetical protein